MTHPTVDRIGTYNLLGLSRVSGTILLALFVITQIALGLTRGSELQWRWQTVTALVIVMGAAVLVVFPGPIRLGRASTFAILGAVVASTALITAILPTENSTGGYDWWYLGANTFLLLGLALRGRIRWAWVGMAAMSAIAVVWTWQTGQGAMFGVSQVDRQWGTLVMGTLFALGIAATGRRIKRVTDSNNARFVEEEFLRVAAQERASQLDVLERVAGPTLRSIAAGEGRGPEARASYLALEAELRDRIRAKAFIRESLVESSRAARARGVHVVLLDDSNDIEISRANSLELAEWTARSLDLVSQGTFTARVRSTESGLSATIVTTDANVELNLSLDLLRGSEDSPDARSGLPS